MDKLDSYKQVLFGGNDQMPEVKNFDVFTKYSEIMECLFKIQSTAGKDLRDEWMKTIRTNLKEINSFLNRNNLKSTVMALNKSWEKIYSAAIKGFKSETNSSKYIGVVRSFSTIPEKCPWSCIDFMIDDKWNDTRIDSEIKHLANRLITERDMHMTYGYPWYDYR